MPATAVVIEILAVTALDRVVAAYAPSFLRGAVRW
jgi:hypothetical protein